MTNVVEKECRDVMQELMIGLTLQIDVLFKNSKRIGKTNIPLMSQ